MRPAGGRRWQRVRSWGRRQAPPGSPPAPPASTGRRARPPASPGSRAPGGCASLSSVPGVPGLRAQEPVTCQGPGPFGTKGDSTYPACLYTSFLLSVGLSPGLGAILLMESVDNVTEKETEADPLRGLAPASGQAPRSSVRRPCDPPTGGKRVNCGRPGGIGLQMGASPPLRPPPKVAASSTWLVWGIL